MHRRCVFQLSQPVQPGHQPPNGARPANPLRPSGRQRNPFAQSQAKSYTPTFCLRSNNGHDANRQLPR